MPRRQRMYLPGVPAHVVQRGVNRTACFFTDDDYRCYLTYLKKCLPRYRVRLHAYVLGSVDVPCALIDDARRFDRNFIRHGTAWKPLREARE